MFLVGLVIVFGGRFWDLGMEDSFGEVVIVFLGGV